MPETEGPIVRGQIEPQAQRLGGEVPSFAQVERARPAFWGILCLSCGLHAAVAFYLPGMLDAMPWARPPAPTIRFAVVRPPLIVRMPDQPVVYFPRKASARARVKARQAAVQVRNSIGRVLIQPPPLQRARPKQPLPSLSVWSGAAEHRQIVHAPGQLHPQRPPELAAWRVTSSPTLPGSAPAPKLPLPVMPPPAPVAAKPHREETDTETGDSRAGLPASVIAIGERAARPGEVVEVPPGQLLDGLASLTELAATIARTVTPESHTMAAPPVATPPEARTSARPDRHHADGGTGPETASGPHPKAAAESKSNGHSARSPSVGGSMEARTAADGNRHLTYPPNGTYDVVILSSAAGDDVADIESLLTGRPIRTVYLNVGLSQEWILKFCLPADGPATSSGDMVVRLDRPPTVTPPFLLDATLPNGHPIHPEQSWLLHGRLGVDGRFLSLEASGPEGAHELLPYVRQWRFKPAQKDGAPAEVEVAVIIPRWIG
jgi:hypothetical protein